MRTVLHRAHAVVRGTLAVRLANPGIQTVLFLFALCVLVGCSKAKEHPVLQQTQQAAESCAGPVGVPGLGGFALYAQDGLFATASTVVGGDVGVKENSGSLFSNFPLFLNDRTHVDLARKVYAPSVLMDSDSTAGVVSTDLVEHPGAYFTGWSPFPPSMPAMPAMPALSAGSDSLVVEAEQTVELAPTAQYASITVQDRGRLRLTGGTYQIGSLALWSSARVEALAPVDLRIAQTLNVALDAHLGPASGTVLTAKDVVVRVQGSDPPDGGAVMIGNRGDVRALVMAPNGTIMTSCWNEPAHLQGAFIGKFIYLATGTMVDFEDGFAADPSIPACPASCTASLTPSLSGFAVYGRRQVSLQNATVTGGDVGAQLASQTESPVSLIHAALDPGRTLFGASVAIDGSSTAGTVTSSYVVEQPGGSYFRYGGPFPSPMPAVPEMPAVNPGTDPAGASDGQTGEVPAGAYAELFVGNGATVVLTGGVYQVGHVTVFEGGSLLAAAPVELRIATNLHVNDGAHIGFVSGTGRTARDLLIEIQGADPEGYAVMAGAADIHALLLAPHGNIVIGGQFRGAVVGDAVWTWQEAHFAFEDGFPGGPPLPGGNNHPGLDTLALNGGFECDASNWFGGYWTNQGWRPGDTQVVRVPGANGSQGALRVSLPGTYPPDGVPSPPVSYSTGAHVSLRETIRAGTWIRVTYDAKRISGTPYLGVERPYGGANAGGPVTLTDEWRSYAVTLRPDADTWELVFTLHQSPIQYVIAAGEFLLDNVSITRLANCADVPAGVKASYFDCLPPQTGPGQMLQVGFNAASIDGPPYLRVTGPFGGDIGDNTMVALGGTTAPYQVSVRNQNAGAPLSFRLVPYEYGNQAHGTPGNFTFSGLSFDVVPECNNNPDLETLALNGSFECDRAYWEPVVFTAQGARGGLIQLARIPGANGSQGALKVTMPDTYPPDVHADIGNAGALVAFKESIPAGTWLAVAFDAKRISGSPYLAVLRPFGGGVGYAGLTDEWRPYSMAFRLDYATNGLFFTRYDGSTGVIAGGEFALDNVRIARTQADGTPCDDGNICTENDAYNAGTCRGTPKACAGGDTCHPMVCQPSTGQCAPSVALVGTACSDGNACTNRDACNALGTCVGTPVDCNDANRCTTDSCDSSIGCVSIYNPAACPAGVPPGGYRLSVIEPLPGHSQTYARGLNEAGVVVGYSTDGTCAHPILFTEAGGVQPIGIPDHCGYGSDINDAGQILLTQERTPGQADYVVYRVTGGVPQEIGTNPSNPRMNDRGQVSYLSPLTTPRHVYRYTDGTGVEDLGSLLGIYPAQIDDFGGIVGWYRNDLTANDTHAIRYVEGIGFRDLNDEIGPALGWTLRQAWGTNGHQIVGSALRNGVHVGFSYDNGALLEIPGLPGFDLTTPVEINAAKEIGGVVAVSIGGSNKWGRATIYTEGMGVRNLNELIDPSAGWVLQTPLRLNDRGQLLVRGMRAPTVPQGFTGPDRVFLLTPIDPCANRPEGASCADGNPCNAQNTCRNGACVQGIPIACDDNNPCTTDTCDPAAGSCRHAPDTTMNGRACAATGLDPCSSRVCEMGSCNPDPGRPPACGLEPVLTCVTARETGYTAVLGYRNKLARQVKERAGSLWNWTAPGDRVQGQPSIFDAGGPESEPKHNAFTIDVATNDALTWHLGQAAVTALPTDRSCSSLAQEDCAAGEVKVDGQCVAAPMTWSSLETAEVVTPLSADGKAAYATTGTFSVSDDGAARYSIPIWTPPAILAPTLAIEYDSRSGDSSVGLGWNLRGDVISQITRCPRTVAQLGMTKPVQYDATDAFCLDGNLLILSEGTYGGNGAIYYTERNTFAQITSINPDEMGPARFEVRTKGGRTLTYGSAVEGGSWRRSADDNGGLAVTAVRASWELLEVKDRGGNKLTLGYTATRGDESNGFATETRLDYVNYVPLGNSEPGYSIRLKYDALGGGGWFAAGVQHVSSRLLSAIEIKAAPGGQNAVTIRRYRLTYEAIVPRPADPGQPAQGVPVLHDVLQFVWECDRGNVCGRPLELSYSALDTNLEFAKAAQPLLTYGPILDHRLADIDGDGRPDLVYMYRRSDSPTAIGWAFRLNDGHGVFGPEKIVEQVDGMPRVDGGIFTLISTGLDDQLYLKTPSARVFDTVDFNSDGAADIVGAWRYATVCNTLGTGSVVYERWVSSFKNNRTFINQTFVTDGSDQDDLAGAVPCGKTSTDPVISRVADLNGDGFPDFLRSRLVDTTPPLDGYGRSAWFIRMNRSGFRSVGSNEFMGATFLKPPPGVYPKNELATLPDGRVVLASGKTFADLLDVDGDGAVELLQTATFQIAPTGVPGFSENVEYKAHSFGSRRQRDFEDAAGAGVVEVTRVHTGLRTALVRRGVNGEKFMDQRPITWADLNGDGLKDAVHQPECGGDATVQMNLGGSFGPEIAAGGRLGQRRGSCVWSNTDDYPTAPLVADVNMDGREELILLDSGILNPSRPDGDRTNAEVLFWTGSEFAVYQTAIPTVKFGGRHQMVDIDGDGVPELIVERNRTLELWRRTDKKPGLLTQVKDGRGVVTHVDYQSISSRAVHTLDDVGVVPGTLSVKSGAMWLVAAHDTTFEAGSRHFQHRYWGARADAAGRGWLGFRHVEHRDVEGGRTTTRLFDLAPHRLGGDDVISAVGEQGLKVYPFAGQPTVEYSTVNTDATHKMVTSRRTTFANIWGPPSYWVYPQRIEEGVFEEEWDPVTDPEDPPLDPLSITTLRSSLTVQTFGVQVYGNLETRETVVSDDAIPSGADIGSVAGDRFKTSYSYYQPDRAHWYVGMVDTKSIEIAGRNGDIERHSWKHTHDPETGLLSKVVQEPGKGSTLELTTDIQRYANGLAQKVTITAQGKPARLTEYVYDPFGGGTPYAVTNPEGHTTRFFYSPRIGELLATTDPNGVITQWNVDGFGQVLAEIRGTNDRTDLTYDFDPSNSRLTIVSTASTGAWQEATVDNQGHVVQRRFPKYSGGVTRELIGYDLALGLPVVLGVPGDATTPTLAATWSYDRTGRLVRAQREQAVTQYSYDGREVGITTQPQGTAFETVTVLTKDAFGRTVLVIERKNDSWLATKYDYGAGRQLRTVSSGVMGQPLTVQETVSYEGDTGRRHSVTTSSAGMTTFTWNAFGELEQEERAKSDTAGPEEREKEIFQYDSLGRRTSTTVGAKSATWQWDESTMGIGALSRAESLDGVKTTFSYGGRGWLIGRGWEYAEKQYALTFGHDALGRVSRIDYPGACGGRSFAVQYGYDDGEDRTGLQQQVEDVAGDRVFWRVQARNGDNDVRAVEMDLVGGTVGLSQIYERQRPGMITRIETRTGGVDGALLNGMGYRYTGSGRLEYKDWPSRTEKFTYDGLERLQSWEDTGGGWNVSWTYDDIGNLTQRQLTGSSSNETLDYHHNDAARPQLVTSSSFGEYGYDWKGNRNVTPEWQIDYTSFDLPKVVSDRAGHPVQSYVYDADNARFGRGSGTATSDVVYVAGLYERRGQTNVYHIVAEGGLIAQVECDDSSGEKRISYLERDYEGTVIATLKVNRQNGVSVEREEQSFDPFGNSINADSPVLQGAGASPLASVRTGYTGHESDREVGLINMNGRVFDPKTMRFLTADPFASGGGSQAINRFAYVQNDPVNLVDPSGFDGTTVTCSVNGGPEKPACDPAFPVGAPTPGPWSGGYVLPPPPPYSPSGPGFQAAADGVPNQSVAGASQSSAWSREAEKAKLHSGIHPGFLESLDEDLGEAADALDHDHLLGLDYTNVDGEMTLRCCGPDAIVKAFKLLGPNPIGGVGATLTIESGAGRAFWSGVKATDAETAAASEGFRSLGTTLPGRAIAGLQRVATGLGGKQFGRSLSKPFWWLGSAWWAKGATGRALIITSMQGTLREKSLLLRLEAPILMRNASVQTFGIHLLDP